MYRELYLQLAASPSTSLDCPKMSTTERTFIAVKPDGVQRNLVAKIIGRFEERGYKLVAIKMVHYQDLKDKPFFNGLIEYMTSGPIVATVWEGLDVVKQGRKILGATNPLQSEPGTIRGDLCIQTGRNVCHGSDSVESANREIKHWFKDDELVDWKPAAQPWTYE
ncbi:Nucleoside diphosphate kinase [Aphelenchoides fujianensis]|nr:Nucleoside diphosphate kinase [Aphelenchoides fujianensis]